MFRAFFRVVLLVLEVLQVFSTWLHVLHRVENGLRKLWQLWFWKRLNCDCKKNKIHNKHNLIFIGRYLWNCQNCELRDSQKSQSIKHNFKIINTKKSVASQFSQILTAGFTIYENVKLWALKYNNIHHNKLETFSILKHDYWKWHTWKYRY